MSKRFFVTRNDRIAVSSYFSAGLCANALIKICTKTMHSKFVRNIKYFTNLFSTTVFSLPSDEHLVAKTS